ncbi:hypothetical protein [Segetibacter aerophilus]|uniref:Uncharacterized protein n=1 Tax=Segetibacter aerophilus TaxID=670293 RepID=A0A512BJD3_9BACT|nr:hypothetical protein [Segetibacter aerophilus]GEO12076.1 hypothetical protein SAE01_45720 [Segetibacter aerophilus]
MKKQSTKAVSTKVFTFLFAVLISCGFAQNTYALPDSTSAKSVEVTYQGLKDKKLAFNVNYKNESAQPFQLTIRNDQDQIIYASKFDGTPLNKTMLFSEFPENSKLTFSIITAKEKIAQSFEINTQVRTVEEFIVKGI